MIVRFWGVRGSIPVPGPQTLHFGGNTSCIEVRCGEKLVILDGGTGLRLLGEQLKREGITGGIFLFSHAHWDHIQGFPFFLPAYDPKARFEILGGETVGESLREALTRQMQPPNFPVRLRQMGAKFSFSTVKDGKVFVRNGIEIGALKLRHPDPSFGYRIRHQGSVVVFATDNEHTQPDCDRQLVEFAKGADLLIYDAQFTTAEYEGRVNGHPRRGWGHSTAVAGARLAAAAAVGRLVLFHHDPTHGDDIIRCIEKEAQQIFPSTQAAFEGLTIRLGE
jgi:phosphoribosyl 1,2-cyclic phosphodiesterase